MMWLPDDGQTICRNDFPMMAKFTGDVSLILMHMFMLNDAIPGSADNFEQLFCVEPCGSHNESEGLHKHRTKRICA